MFRASLGQVARATGGRILLGHKDDLVTGTFTDSRKPVRGGLFIAIKGDAFDGHDYIEAAFAEGCGAVLISKPETILKADEARLGGVVCVEDTRAGFLQLARMHRDNCSAAHWFGVTGSVGKSSVKEILAHVLEHAGWPTHRAIKSFNNEIGVPTTILGVEAHHRAVIIEMGTNHPGEIAPLAAAARPQVAILTNAGPSHLEGLGSVRGVAEEKAHILDFQSRDDLAVLNADDPFFRDWVSKSRGRVLSFGFGEGAEVRAVGVEHEAHGMRFHMRVSGASSEIRINLPGRHSVLNALAAAAAALGAGLDVGTIGSGLSSFKGMARRFQRLEHKGVAIIDDAYNANPLSFNAALDALRVYAGRRLFVVAGSMLELGDEALALHAELGRRLSRCHLSGLFSVGALAESAGRAAVANGFPEASWQHCDSPEMAADGLSSKLMPGDVVLVKGSNGMHLDRCVERLMERGSGASSKAHSTQVEASGE